MKISSAALGYIIDEFTTRAESLVCMIEMSRPCKEQAGWIEEQAVLVEILEELNNAIQAN